MTDYERMKLIKMIRNAVYPWAGSQAKRQKEYRQTDSEEQIERCLHCTFPECVNCCGDKMYAFAVLFRSGMGQREICNALNICKRTFFNFKSQLAKGA